MGKEWVQPTEWFTRLRTHEEELKAKKAAQLSNIALARFKAYSAEQAEVSKLRK